MFPATATVNKNTLASKRQQDFRSHAVVADLLQDWRGNAGVSVFGQREVVVGH